MKSTLLGLVGVVVILILATTTLVLLDKPVPAAVIGAGTVAMILLLIILAAFGLGSYWEREGARFWTELSLRSQESDDKRDIAQIRAATDLVKVLMRQQERQPQMPLLPSQSDSWLPVLEIDENE